MDNYKNSTRFNKEGYFDPTAFSVIGYDYEDFSNYIIDCVRGPNQYRRSSPWGVLKFIDRRQYIRDKLCMIRDEFFVMASEDDIRYLVKHCFTRDTIDKYCRRLFFRE